MDDTRALLITTRNSGENERKTFLNEIEMRSLISTLGINIVYHLSFTIKEENKTTFFGKGQIEEIRSIVENLGVDEIIVDSFLNPKQEMKIEEALSLAVSDREAVILSIFLLNAHSKEAKLQIKKAEALYAKPRLISREANYSQQRGGVRGAKGEGEKQLELKRRTIDRLIASLDKEIDEVKKTRITQRKKREKNAIFSFALTGYTNAGKTTILNALSPNTIAAEDKLFATLDTTTRLITLPSGEKTLISDTVGFIQNLPHLLIDAFSSTLEEALEADAIIVVADASHPDCIDAFNSTLNTLEELKAKDKIKLVIINKIDSFYDDISLSYLRSVGYKTIETNMKDKEKAKKTILSALDEIVSEYYINMTLSLDYSSPIFSRLSAEGKIVNAKYEEDKIIVTIKVLKEERERHLPFVVD